MCELSYASGKFKASRRNCSAVTTISNRARHDSTWSCENEGGAKLWWMALRERRSGYTSGPLGFACLRRRRAGGKGNFFLMRSGEFGDERVEGGSHPPVFSKGGF